MKQDAQIQNADGLQAISVINKTWLEAIDKQYYFEKKGRGG